MRALIITITLLLILLALVSCKTEFAADIFIQDLADLSDGESQVLFTSAKIAFESPSSSERQNVINFITENFREAKNFHDEERGMDTLIVADIKVPVTGLSNIASVNGDDLITIVVERKDEKTISFGVYFNQEKFQAMQKYISEEFYQDLSIKDMTLFLKVSNDMRQDVKLTLRNVYADQKPILFTDGFLLSRRDTVNIRFSDVLRDYIHDNGHAIFGEISL